MREQRGAPPPVSGSKSRRFVRSLLVAVSSALAVAGCTRAQSTSAPASGSHRPSPASAPAPASPPSQAPAPTPSAPATIPQPPLGELNRRTRRRLAPETRRVDLALPTFSNPTDITNPLFPIGELRS